MVTCLPDIPPQLIEDFHLSVKCSTHFQEIKAKGYSHLAYIKESQIYRKLENLDSRPGKIFSKKLIIHKNS
jgi:hypothetical protein